LKIRGREIFGKSKIFFELSNHLGNVLVTISDKKLAVDSDNDGLVNYYNADVVTASDYYPFGSQMPGRKFSQPNSSYRYGFNGKELDNSTGEGNLDFGSRIYDNRLGRWLGVDKFTKKYPNVSPYAFCINSPLQFKDANGDWLLDKNGNIIYTIGETVYEIIDNVVYYSRKYFFYTNDGQAVEAFAYYNKTTVDNVKWKDGIVSPGNVLGVKDKAPEAVKKGESKAYNCHGNSLNIEVDKEFDLLFQVKLIGTAIMYQKFIKTKQSLHL
jgi:RHS repeat-associated protein